ncbi:MAG: hypothetical protein J1F68_01710 [Clostridiales bacterium]|nr:hypothetical protein [Clostridiales bacterium]
MAGLKKLKTLVMMQLRDKLDLSFVRSARSTIIKVGLAIIKLAVVVAIFYLLFMVCNMLSIFYPSSFIPDTVVNVLFTLIQVMSIITCTVGLTQTLYMTADNRVLLTLPVSSTQVYISKLILYYIFELKKNITLTLPLFVAYGMINGAVWYYYLWLLFCFLFVSLVPVAIAAIVSIPTLYVWQFVKKFKWLQAILTLAGASLVTWGIVVLIGLIPSNINILGQWYAITLSIQDFLNAFAKYSAPYYYLTLMIVGGTLRIGARLIQGDTFMYWGIMVGAVAVLLALSFAIAKPMFVWMASKQFEYEKRKVKPQKNKVHRRRTSPFFESMKMDVRSSRFLIMSFIQLVLPAIAILFLNRLYAAMNTNYSGQVMTKAFNLLVMLVITLAFNNVYACVYSKEAAARNILKTRPQKPIYTLFGRIVFRAGVIVVSTALVVVAFILALAYKNVDGELVYQALSSDYLKEIVLMGVITLLVAESHLLWCAEMDIMRNFADQYQTVGVQYDSPNERNATIIGFLLSALFTVMYYLFSDRGTQSALIKGVCIAAVIVVARIYLYVTRSKLYFVEK